jgi:hypothetical protein
MKEKIDNLNKKYLEILINRVETFIEILPNTIRTIMKEVEEDNKKNLSSFNYKVIVKREVGVYLSKLKMYCQAHFTGLYSDPFCLLYK